MPAAKAGVKAPLLVLNVERSAVVDEFTVMVKVIGVPLQPVPVTKFPTELGDEPTGTVAINALVVVLITDTLFWFSTYKVVPSGLSDTPVGLCKVAIIDPVYVLVFITTTAFERLSAT